MKTKNQAMDSEGSFSKLVPVILKKGIENVNLSMFTDETRNQILEAVGDEYVKRGATKALSTFLLIGNRQKIVTIGDNYLNMGMYDQAIESYNVAGSREKLVQIGDRCIKEGNEGGAIKAYRYANEKEKLNDVGEICIKKGKLDFAIEVFSVTKNIPKLIEIGDSCVKESHQLENAARAYEAAGDKELLNKVGDTFLKEGRLNNALITYEAAGNEIMINFIKENFSERDLKKTAYV